MNILIVDDNKNNRMVLSLLLEDYVEENPGIEFDVDEAGDGIDAIAMCDKKAYEIVLMDIMMPRMDGIEATQLIRQKHKKVMIIAVSAVDDADRQKLILSHGAEDYISKPVNADIFQTRIANYITIIQSRTHKKINEDGINIFTKAIYKHFMKFMLSTEDGLSELWEYYLLGEDEKYDNSSDLIRTVFSIAEIQVKLDIAAELYVEENEDNLYFTLTNIDEVSPQILNLAFKKNSVSCEYKNSDNKLSFELPKVVSSVIVQEKPIVTAEPVQVAVESVQEDSSIYKSASLEVFDYMDPDDLFDLEEFAGKLSSLMLIVGGGDVTQDEVAEIRGYIEKIASVLSTYSEIYVISKALSRLGVDLEEYSEEFIKNSEALAPMARAFAKDLNTWVEQSFHTGAPSVDFMNDTISVNCDTISSMLKMNDAPAENAEEFDDIFDF